MSSWQMATTHLRVNGMTCQGCVSAVKMTLVKLPGVENAEVDLEASRAVVDYDPARIEPAAMITALGNLGYDSSLEQAA